MNIHVLTLHKRLAKEKVRKMCILCRFRVPNLNDMTGYNVGKGIVPRPTIMIIMSTTSAASATAAAMSGRAHDELAMGAIFQRTKSFTFDLSSS